MISFKKSNIVQIKDRKLGDEWLDWGGSLAEYEKNANAGKRTFLGVLLFLILLTGASAYFIWYMIAPRLEQFHQTLPLIAGILFFIGWCILSLPKAPGATWKCPGCSSEVRDRLRFGIWTPACPKLQPCSLSPTSEGLSRALLGLPRAKKDNSVVEQDSWGANPRRPGVLTLSPGVLILEGLG